MWFVQFCLTLLKKDDWGLDDPTGKDDDEFIEVIRTIEKKVKELIEELES